MTIKTHNKKIKIKEQIMFQYFDSDFLDHINNILTEKRSDFFLCIFILCIRVVIFF